MPQLVKGGKYIFGRTKINDTMKIRIPDEAWDEYGFSGISEVLLLSASKTSGGFSIHRPDVIMKSKLKSMIAPLGYSEETNSFKAGFQDIFVTNGRLMCRTLLDENKYIVLSEKICDRLNLRTGDYLLVGRGSGLGPAFIAKGPIYSEAEKHDNIPEFQ